MDSVESRDSDLFLIGGAKMERIQAQRKEPKDFPGPIRPDPESPGKKERKDYDTEWTPKVDPPSPWPEPRKPDPSTGGKDA